GFRGLDVAQARRPGHARRPQAAHLARTVQVLVAEPRFQHREGQTRARLSTALHLRARDQPNDSLVPRPPRAIRCKSIGHTAACTMEFRVVATIPPRPSTSRTRRTGTGPVLRPDWRRLEIDHQAASPGNGARPVPDPPASPVSTAKARPRLARHE